MESETPVALILAVVAAIIVVGIYFLWQEVISKSSQDEACRLSIFAAARTSFLREVRKVANVPTVQLDCPSDEIMLRYKDVVRKSAIDQEKVHDILTKEMHRCWSKVGEGKIDPFASWGSEGESYCLICGVVKFDDNLKDFIREHAKDVKEDTVTKYLVTSPLHYLATHTIPAGKDKGRTYWEYLWHQNPPSGGALHGLQDVSRRMVVLPGSAIVVQMYKPDDPGFWMRVSGIGAIAGGAILAVGGVVVTVASATTLAPVGAVLASTGAKLAEVGVVAVGASFFYNYYGDGVVVSTWQTSFRDCKDCDDGIGGIQMVFADQAFTEKVPLAVTVDGKEQKKEVPLCTRFVNA